MPFGAEHVFPSTRSFRVCHRWSTAPGQHGKPCRQRAYVVGLNRDECAVVLISRAEWDALVEDGPDADAIWADLAALVQQLAESHREAA